MVVRKLWSLWWPTAAIMDAAAALVFVQRTKAPRPLMAAAPMEEEELSRLSRSELEELVRTLSAENAAMRRSQEAGLVRGSPLAISEVCELAGYAFESYNAPLGARWERGADGCDVAFSSAGFVRECYAGAVVVRVVEVRDLPGQKDLSEVALTGASSDPYVTLAVVEAANGPLSARAGNATDVARSTTVWRGGSRARWPENETYTLFVRDPRLARLAVTVLDEDVGDDDVLGAAELPLWRAVSGKKIEHTLQLRAEKRSFDAGAGLVGAAAAAMAGAATAGVAVVALAAAAAAGAADAERRGRIELRVEWVPFRDERDVVALAPSLSVRRVLDKPKGASPGVDWSFAPHRGAEALCFVDHARTGTQAGIWRDASRRRLVVAFRGTSEPRDIVTDASAAMTPWAREALPDIDGFASVPAAVGDPRVHAGFRGALESISRRLKQLIAVAAADDLESPWHLALTGHSLGGALATLFALDVTPGVFDRALPVRPPLGQPWLLDVITGAASLGVDRPALRTDVRLLTFGAPRAGDLAFVRALDANVPDHFRVVNGQDIVARLPRGFAYAHAGRTVLVDEDPDRPPLWVEGLDRGPCPLKRADEANVLSSPFAPGSALAALVDDALNSTQSDPSATTWNPFATTIDAAVKFRDLAFDTITQKSPAQLAALAGVDPDYAEFELKLLAALSSGDAIVHHLEPAYFKALRRAYDANA